MAEPWKLWKSSFRDLQKQVDQLFDEMLFRRWDISPTTPWRPLVDVHEMRNSYLVEVELPGVDVGEVQLMVSHDRLSITGKRDISCPKEAIVNRCERFGGPFQREIAFGQLVIPQMARAEYNAGILRIFVPKRPPHSESQNIPEGESGEVPHHIEVIVHTP